MAFGITTFAEAPFAATGSSNATAAVTGISLASSIGAVQSVTGDANINNHDPTSAPRNTYSHQHHDGQQQELPQFDHLSIQCQVR